MTTVNITNNTGPINNYPLTYILTKACNTCRQIKPLTDFYKDKSKHDGDHSQCITCKNNRQKEYYNKNKDKICMKVKEYYTNNQDKIK